MFSAETIRARRAARESRLVCAICIYTGGDNGVARPADTVIGGTAACFPCLDEYPVHDDNVSAHVQARGDGYG